MPEVTSSMKTWGKSAITQEKITSLIIEKIKNISENNMRSIKFVDYQTIFKLANILGIISLNRKQKFNSS